MKSIYENPECVFYKYEVVWSKEDEAYIGSVKEFPSLLAHHERSFTKALSEIVHVVDITITIMKEDGEEIPQPEGFTRFKEKEEKKKRDFSLDAAAISELYCTGYLTEDQKRFTDAMLWHAPRSVDITLNGKELRLTGHDAYNLTYERIVELAEMSGNPSVTYYGRGTEHGGILHKGTSVNPCHGMVINCCDTSNA